MNEIIATEYRNLLNDIVANIEKARVQASKMINSTFFELNYNLGKLIIERQKKFDWGSSVIKQLSKDLNTKYGNLKGYSIGIILCADKNNLTVEYALRTSNRPIGVAEYELKKEIENKLPSLDEIKEQIKKNIAF